MLSNNDYIRDYLGVTAWHKAGYTGKRVKMATCEDWTTTAHAKQVYSVIKEFVPDAEIVYIQAPSGAMNSTFADDIAANPEICVATSSLYMPGNSSDISDIDAVLDKYPYLSFCFAAGNDYAESYLRWIDCKNIWGVGAVGVQWSHLINGQPADDAELLVQPMYYSSEADAVDFAAPTGIVTEFSGLGFTGTSCATPVLASICALINDYFIAMTGHPLSREMMYQFLRDISSDIYTKGKDRKTGYGVPILPPVENIDVARYIMGEGDEMIQSRNVSDLRADVAVNCQTFIDMCKAEGYAVGISCTYRDQEYQTYLYDTINAPATVTFHGARLAFDIFQNIKGREYENTFFDAVAPIAKKIGFSWMWDIAGNEKCHFQWDDHRKYHNADILSGNLPPEMPAYKTMIIEEDENMTGEEIYKALDEYCKNLPLPGWAEKEFQEAIDAGITDGTNPMQLIPRYQAALMAYRARKGE